MSMELEIINKLFLELSQIATATTRKELNYETALRSIMEAPTDTDGTLLMRMRLIAKEALNDSSADRGALLALAARWLEEAPRCYDAAQNLDRNGRRVDAADMRARADQLINCATQVQRECGRAFSVRVIK